MGVIKVKSLLALIGFFSVYLFAADADADLEVDLRNESGHKIYVKAVEANYSILSEAYSIPDEEIEERASFHRSISILLRRYFEYCLGQKKPDAVTFGIEGDDTGDFSISWDQHVAKISCPKGYRVKQSKDHTRFSFTLLPD